MNTFEDVIGVVKSVGDLQTFQARSTGKELKKKEVVIVDQSQKAVSKRMRKLKKIIDTKCLLNHLLILAHCIFIKTRY